MEATSLRQKIEACKQHISTLPGISLSRDQQEEIYQQQQQLLKKKQYVNYFFLKNSNINQNIIPGNLLIIM